MSPASPPRSPAGQTGSRPRTSGAEICGNPAELEGPSSAPPGSVRVDPGTRIDHVTQAHSAGTTYWIAPGRHVLGSDEFDQVIPKDGNSYVGAPGAILDGQKINRYAFTQQARNVTIRYLTIQNFGTPGGNNNEGVVNQGAATAWVIEHNTIGDNAGAGVFLGSENVLRKNCLLNNEQYGVSMYKPPVPGRSAITDVTVDQNEVAGNNTYDWESRKPGCGCSGGAKFWDVQGAVVSNNWVHDNKGVGLWFDTNDIDVLIQRNHINDNDGEGIWYEIGYNFVIRDNVLVRNAIVKGREFADGNDPFPVGAIYVSESGGDARASDRFTTAEISGNVFIDNWAGVVLWENANRFCNSPANTSGGYCTRVNPTVTLDTCVAGRITTEPYYGDCRWKTQNVHVHDNEFRIDKRALACGEYCGVQGLLSNRGREPDWSPYKGTVVQDTITFHQNNRYFNNRYVGEWHFVGYDRTKRLDLATWRAGPYRQDAGSTITMQ